MAGAGPGTAPEHLQTAGSGNVAGFCMSARQDPQVHGSQLAGAATLPWPQIEPNSKHICLCSTVVRIRLDRVSTPWTARSRGHDSLQAARTLMPE